MTSEGVEDEITTFNNESDNDVTIELLQSANVKGARLNSHPINGYFLRS